MLPLKMWGQNYFLPLCVRSNVIDHSRLISKKNWDDLRIHITIKCPWQKVHDCIPLSSDVWLDESEKQMKKTVKIVILETGPDKPDI